MAGLGSPWDEADWWVHYGQTVVKSMIQAHFESNLNWIFNVLFKTFINVH